jgi:uncharacterized membrane protein YoaK (UPF0700 family)
MFEHRMDLTADRRVVLHWYLLSFNGGCINAGGFLATGRFVSHVTGFATLFGASAVDHEFGSALGILSVPFFFLLGAFLAGLLIDRPIHLGKKPHFDYAMGLSAICLFFAAGGGELAQFGRFGEMLQLKQVYVLLSLLCLACGLQNGAITSSSGSSVRTTHLTGLTTDLGLGLAKLFTYSPKEQSFKQEVHLNNLRSGSIIAFVFGSGVGAWIFIQLGYRGFVASALISCYVAYRGHKVKVVAHKQKDEFNI